MLIKDDFSGYEVKPLTLLKLMIKDYDELESTYKRYAKEIESDIN